MEKDTYIRLRCTEVQKEKIKAFAKANAMSMSEYILSLVKEDEKYYFEKDIYAVYYKNGGVEIKRELVASVLCDSYGRIDIDVYNKFNRSFLSRYENLKGRYFSYECDGYKINNPVPTTSYVCIDRDMFNKAQNK